MEGTLLPRKRFLLDLAPGGGLPTPQPSDSEGEDFDQNSSPKKPRIEEEEDDVRIYNNLFFFKYINKQMLFRPRKQTNKQKLFNNFF